VAKITLPFVGNAAVIEGARVFRIQLECLIIIRDGSIKFTFGTVNVATIIEGGIVFRVKFKKLIWSRRLTPADAEFC